MTAWVGDLGRALARGEPAVLVTVAHVVGSTPREAGAAMVVTTATVHGTIGGGHLEFEAIRIARDALANTTAPTSNWLVRFPLAARLGQCCGGVATLAFTAVAAGAHAWLDAAVDCVRLDTPFALVTRVGIASDASSPLLVTLDDAHGALANPLLESSAIALARTRVASGRAGASLIDAPDPVATLLIHVACPDAFPIFVFGNGHVGRALVHVLGALPARVRWIDTRENDFPAQVPDNVEVVVSDAPEDELAQAPHRAFVVVMTHSHPLDLTLIETALARDDWRYLGLIGSRSKRAQFEQKLAARGVGRERSAKVVCPIGVGSGNAIRSKEPGAIAIAVAAEIVAVRDACTARSDTTSHPTAALSGSAGRIRRVP
jgi:xanthine dehydrogenase accessory factor